MGSMWHGNGSFLQLPTLLFVQTASNIVQALYCSLQSRPSYLLHADAGRHLEHTSTGYFNWATLPA